MEATLDGSARLASRAAGPQYEGSFVAELARLEAGQEGLLVRASGGSASGQLAILGDGSLNGRVSAAAKTVVARSGALSLHGRPTLTLEAQNYQAALGQGKLTAQLLLRQVSLEDAGPEQQCPIGSSPRIELTLDHEPRSSAASSTSLRASIGDSRLAWGDLDVRARGSLSLRLDEPTGPGTAATPDRNGAGN